jgi:hypothetical protein
MAVDEATAGVELATAFGTQLGRYDAWRRDLGARLKAFIDRLIKRGLVDAAVRERSTRLLEQIKSGKVVIAFVAEFSRGKSELINAVFFAGYGRRIMPTSAGRTTMCPTELGYDSAMPPCLCLLPIETRLQPQALMEWRLAPEKWTRVDLDVNNSEQLATALEKVSEVQQVSREWAQQLGFWHDDKLSDNPPVDSNGLMEVPRWRHALINMAHPLLQQGLVVLDTPGLNAIGAEPELTVNLIPQADGVVFILGADAGVTRSDLEIWRQHLASLESGSGIRLVALNKIDTLWDELRPPEQIAAQIERQRQETASVLGLTSDQVVAISAQKGLLAKVRGDAALLQASQLPLFENLLAHEVLGRRQELLEHALRAGVAALQTSAQGIIEAQRRELARQATELGELRGKSDVVINRMGLRITQEKDEFDHSAARVLEIRSAHIKLLRSLFRQLGVTSIKSGLLGLARALRVPGIKLGIKREYAQGIENLCAVLRRAQELENEVHGALIVAFHQINTEYGFTLQVMPVPDLRRFMSDLRVIERSHLLYLGAGNVLRLSRPEFCEKLLHALFSRVHSIFETALGELELWDKTVFSELDAQLYERRKAYGRRLDAIKRIQNAADSLDVRLTEIDSQQRRLERTQWRLISAADGLRAMCGASATIDFDLEPPLDLELEFPGDQSQVVAA